MRRFSITLALSTLLLGTICTAQQTAQNTTANPAQADPDELFLPFVGSGTAGTIPLILERTETQLQTGNSPITISNNPQVVVSSAPIDAEGSNPVYEILANPVVSIGPELSDHNVFLGVNAGTYNVAGSGVQNTFVGYESGQGQNNNDTIGTSNTFVGYASGQGNTSGSQNTFIGQNAGNSNQAGNHNVFVGVGAGVTSVTGDDNTFTGFRSGNMSNGVHDNTFYGYQAGYNNVSGNNNTFLGDSAGYNNTSGVGDLYIDNQGPNSGPPENNTIRIGNSMHTAAYIQGVYGGTVMMGDLPVLVDPTGRIGTMTSSLRFKEQVRDMGDSTNGLMKLRPVTFFYKPEYASGERTLQYGLIAEEVAKVYPELVAYDKDGKPYAVLYQYIATMLLNEVQKQYHRAEAQAELIKTQEQKIGELEERLSRVEELVRVELAAAH